MKGLDRLMAYSAAVLCGALLWVGLAWPADTWQKWAGLVAGVAGLAAVAILILRGRWGGR